MKKITDYAELVKEKHALNSALGPVETDLSDASRDYAIGEEFVYDGGLYRAKTAILQHDALVLNTNYEAADSITGQIASVNQALTNEAVTRGSLGAKNLLPNNAVSQTINGVTFTVNADGSVTVNGTATANISYYLNVNFAVSRGDYIFSIDNDLPAGCYIIIQKFLNGVYQSNFVVLESGKTSKTANIDYNGYDGLTVVFSFANGTTFSNVKYSVMLRLATDSDPTYQPYSMTNRELTAIAQAVSNRNLLDNPWFTVNQRGVSSASGAYGFDRWLGIYTVNTSGNGIDLANTNYIIQKLEETLRNNLTGKTLTASVLLSDGRIYSGTKQYSQSESIHFIDNDVLSCDSFSNIDYGFSVTVKTALTIKAVKFELGTVSTLHMDTAPNYAEELLKCQRYFQVIVQGSRWRLDQYGGGGIINIPLPVQMRDRPTPSNTSFYLRSLDLETELAVSSATINPIHNYNSILVSLGASTWNQDGQAYLKDGDLWLSADL